MPNQDGRNNMYDYDNYSYRQDTPPPKRGRAVPKGTRRLLVLVACVLVLLLAAGSVVWMLRPQQEATASQLPQSSQLPQTSAMLSSSSQASLPPSSSQPVQPIPPVAMLDSALWNFNAPLPEAPPLTLNATDARMLSLPENGRVDMSYFDTTVFVGDSLTQGLQLYSQGIPNAQYCAYKGVSPKQIYDGSTQKRSDGVQEIPMEALAAYQPDNVYVLLGTNAMVGMGDEALLTYYSEMLDAMRATLLPEVDIYVQSITPVRQGVDARFDFDRIRSLNDALAKMAYEKGMYYLDLHEALAGNDGWLREDFGASRDAYHMNPSGYAAWVEYLVTHTAENPRHAHLYQEGTHYYMQAPVPEE